MIKKQKEFDAGRTFVEWYEFASFQEFSSLTCRVFTSKGGVSVGPYKGLNISFDVGDNKEHVEINRARLVACFNEEDQTIPFVATNQVHGTAITSLEKDTPLPLSCSSDAISTNLPKRCLAIKHADCQAAVFYDPINHAVGAVHSGWRGNVQNIYEKQVSFMKSRYGTRPENLFVGISPSLGPKNAEFLNYEKEFPKEFFPFQVTPFHFDLWQLSLFQLKELGIKEDHVEIAKMCTYALQDEFFSYRRNKITGRNATCVMLK